MNHKFAITTVISEGCNIGLKLDSSSPADIEVEEKVTEFGFIVGYEEEVVGKAGGGGGTTFIDWLLGLLVRVVLIKPLRILSGQFASLIYLSSCTVLLSSKTFQGRLSPSFKILLMGR